MRHPSAVPRIVAVGLAAFTTVVGLLASPGQAAPRPEPGARPVAGSPAVAAPKPLGAASDGGSEHSAARSAPLPVALRSRPTPMTTADTPSTPPRSRHAAARTTTASCNAADFGNRTGSALVTLVTSSTHECINTLFSLTGTGAGKAFGESQMLTIANALQSSARSYPGDDSTGTWELVLYLRAGYYVQSYNTAAVGSYDATLTAAVRSSLDTFFAGPHVLDVSSGNGDVLGDVITLTDSANLQGAYLAVYKQVLNAYTSSYDAYPSMDGAVNNVYTPLWRGNWNPDFVSAVTADPSILNTLAAFAQNHLSLLGGANGVLDSNAGNDLARMLEHPTLQAAIRPLVKGLLGASAITGGTADLWVHVAYQASSFDQAQCSYYGVCNLTSQLTAASLPTTYACGSRTILAQALSAADLAATCSSLQNQDPFFHSLVKDNGPIPGQYEDTIRIAVFASKNDYAVYSWAIFGNSTDNGGETLTGNPADPANQPVSIMYQKSYDDGFVARIWNLNHEYTHYLDGRYDMKGDFGQEITVPDIWWIEGLAEYVSYTYRGVTDDEAVTEAAKHTYALSTLWQSTYDNSDVTRTYPWGYLAVRYMVEKHPADISAMLARFRAGDYAGGYAVYNTRIGTTYDADFNAWLDACAAGACSNSGSSGVVNGDFEAGSLTGWTTGGTASVVNTGAHGGSYAAQLGGTGPTSGDSTASQTFTVPSDKSRLSFWYNVTCPDTVSYDWATATLRDNTAGTVSTVLTKTCVASSGWTQVTSPVTAGHSYTLTLTSHDDDYAGDPTRTLFDDVTLSAPVVSLPTCTGSDTRLLGQNCSRPNRSASTGNLDYLYIDLPAGTVTLTITTGCGTGDAQLFYNPTTWATPTAYTASSTGAGTTQSITVTNTTAGTRYISLYAQSAFSGVTVSTQF